MITVTLKTSSVFILQTEYLVKWKGYSAFDNSWEQEENLTADLLRYFVILYCM